MGNTDLESLLCKYCPLFWWEGDVCSLVSNLKVFGVSCGSHTCKEAERSALTMKSLFCNLLSWDSELIRCLLIIYQDHF